MGRRHPAQHFACGRAERAGKRHFSGGQAFGGGAHHHLRHGSHSGKRHCQQCGDDDEPGGFRHRPCDDYRGGPVHRRRGSCRRAALYKAAVGGRLREHVGHQHSFVFSGAVSGALLRHAAADGGYGAAGAEREFYFVLPVLAALVHHAQRPARGGRRQIYHDGQHYFDVDIPHRYVVCAGHLAAHGPAGRMGGDADRLDCSGDFLLAALSRPPLGRKARDRHLTRPAESPAQGAGHGMCLF